MGVSPAVSILSSHLLHGYAEKACQHRDTMPFSQFILRIPISETAAKVRNISEPCKDFTVFLSVGSKPTAAKRPIGVWHKMVS